MKNSRLMIMLLVAICLLSACDPFAQAVAVKNETPTIIGVDSFTMTKDKQLAITPEQALQKLEEGNSRFVSGNMLNRNLKNEIKTTAKGQYPFAILLSCIDSRTSSELIFDQGFGDIFNARIAGNFVNTGILGSMEFACKLAGAKLILVVGHSKCGAIKGVCDHVKLGSLTNLIREIEPSVDSVKNINGERNSHNDVFVNAVAIQNVKLAIKEIRDKSGILSEMERKGDIIIAGAMYDLETGKVEFYQPSQAFK